MDGGTLERILQTDSLVNELYGGIYCSDTIPSIKPHSLIVLNTATSHQKYGHYVLISSVQSNRLEYICSADTDFRDYELVASRIQDYCIMHEANLYMFPNACQDAMSTSCSLFILWHAYLISRGFSAKEIWERFYDGNKTKLEFRYKIEALICECCSILYHIEPSFLQKYVYDIRFIANQKKEEKNNEQQRPA